MAQLTAQPPSFVHQPQDKHHGTKQPENPAQDERDRECERNGRANRRHKEVQVNKAGITARENQHRPKHEGDETMPTFFSKSLLQQNYRDTGPSAGTTNSVLLWAEIGKWRLVLDRQVAGRINPFTKVLARLEMRYVLARQRDCFACFRVTTDPGGTEMQ